MKTALLIPLAVAAMAATSHAQTIYRCSGNVYTNDAAEARSKGCKTMEGGNITIVEGTRVNTPVPVKVSTAAQSGATAPGLRIGADEQRARDADARAILEAELKKAEARYAELTKEFNNGEPDKVGPEHRNYQKYLDRVAEMKATITRKEADIAAIKRELAKLPQ